MRGVAALRIVAAFLLPEALLACSAILIVMDGKVLLGHNNDNSYSREMLLRVTPNRDGFLGRVCVSMETVPGWVPVGMKCINERGLAITHAVVPSGDTAHDPDKPQFTHNFLEKIVAECATVKQAISMARAYTFPPEHSASIHLMLADPSGDAAVIEWVAGQVQVLRRSGPTQIMTNSLLSKPSAAEGPNSRLNRGSRKLAQVKDPSVASAVEVLREISIHGRHQGDEVGSVESAVFDITARKVYLYYKRDFDHPLVLSLDDELARGPRTVPFKTLFPNPVPFELGNRYENGPPVSLTS